MGQCPNFKLGILKTEAGFSIFQKCPNCQTPDLGQGLEFDFTFANNNKNKNNNDPHLNFPEWDGTRGLECCTQT